MPPVKFIGLGNYKRMLADPAFWQSVLLLWIHCCISFFRICSWHVFRIGYKWEIQVQRHYASCGTHSVAIPTIISAKLWQLMYNYNYGLLNYILVHLHLVSQPLTGSAAQLVHLLQSSSLMCGRPHRSWLYFSWPDFKRFLIPCMKQPPLMAQVWVNSSSNNATSLGPIIVIALIFRTIDAFRIFDLIYVLTGGGPGGATSSLSIYGFNAYILGDFGFGSAVSVITFLLILVFTIIT